MDDSLSTVIQTEQEIGSKLRLQKHGLMHDLLTFKCDHKIDRII